MQTRKTNFTEEVFLLSTFREFVKCWKSSKRSRLFVDSVNGKAFMNFSVFLGNPSDIHFQSTPRQRKPSPTEKKQRKKSPKKIQRDNERAAKFQEKKRQEEAPAKAAIGVPPPATSSPAASTVRAASVNFSFASPAPEELTNSTMEGISDPTPSPENLSQQLDDPSSFTVSQEESVRENSKELTSENITITEEVLQENKETASEETESPGLAFEYAHDVEAVRKKFLDANPGAKYNWARNSKWFQANDALINDPYLLRARWIYRRRMLRCKKPKLFVGTINKEPCNSPAIDCCACSPRTPITTEMPWDQALR